MSTCYYFKLFNRNKDGELCGLYQKDFVYKINQWTEKEKPILCSRGYHCLRTRDLSDWWYKIQYFESVELCLVKADTTKQRIGTDKVAVSSIRPIRQLKLKRDKFGGAPRFTREMDAARKQLRAWGLEPTF